MAKDAVRLGLVAGAMLGSFLIVGVALYSSLPQTILSSINTSDSSRTSALSAKTSTTQNSTSSSSTNSSSVVFPFDNPGYVVSQGGCGWSSRSDGIWYAEPFSFGGTIGDAMVFNCLAEAAQPSGCTGQISGIPGTTIPAPPPINGSLTAQTPSEPVLNNTITVWYPYVNQTGKESSWANCMFQTQHQAIGPQYGFCIPLNSTSFVVSGPELNIGPYSGP